MNVITKTLWNLLIVFRAVYFNFVPKLRPLESQRKTLSSMAGVFPFTTGWFENYPRTKNSERFSASSAWSRFYRRHELSQKVAKTSLKFLDREVFITSQDNVLLPISIYDSRVQVRGCVGSSLSDMNINFLDTLFVCKNTTKNLSVNTSGKHILNHDGTKIYKDFSIDIGGGITITKGDLAEMHYLKEMVDDAISSCENDKISAWAKNITKVRRIDSLKVLPDNRIFVGVTAFKKGSREEGLDHPIDDILGKLVSVYPASEVRKNIEQKGGYEDVKFALDFSIFVHPECDWEHEFVSLSIEDRTLVQKALMGEIEDLEEIKRARDALNTILIHEKKQSA